MGRDQQIEIGYKLTSEEFPAPALVRFARAAEEHGFAFASISDHYHPWIDREGQSSHRGKYFTVENARIYGRPDEAPPIMIAAAGPKSVKLAAELGDGLIATEPDRELVRKFRESAGAQKPCYGELHVCFDRDE